MHVDDLAGPYALGSLAPAERARVDAHVATCDPCARAVGDAEATVAALVDELVDSVDPPATLDARIAASAAAGRPARAARWAAWPLPSIFAVAAALVIALLAAGGAYVEHVAGVQRAARESAIVATLAESHFLHVALTQRSAAAPVSKAIYARDGSWLYVIVDRADCACHVVVRDAAGSHDLGPPVASGTTATLFVRPADRPSSVALIDAGGNVLAETPLAYAAE